MALHVIPPGETDRHNIIARARANAGVRTTCRCRPAKTTGTRADGTFGVTFTHHADDPTDARTPRTDPEGER